MNLIVDANVLVRCVAGRRAAVDAKQAIERGVELTTTLAQLDESMGVLIRVFGLKREDALVQLFETAELMTVADEGCYAAFREESERRLRRKAQPDWPVLAAALALDAGIWSDDRDFFGTGVAVWSSPNIECAAA